MMFKRRLAETSPKVEGALAGQSLAGRALTSHVVATQPIDFVHLKRQTMGDQALALEVLHLFIGQAAQTLAALIASADQADNDKAWRMAAHTLKGSARVVGAVRVARLSLDAERSTRASGERPALLRSLSEALDEAEATIACL